MAEKDKLIILGGGGHAKVLIGLIKRLGKYDIVGILDSKLQQGDLLLGVSVLGDDQLLQDLYIEGVKAICLGVGSVKINDTRRKLYEKVKAMGFNAPCLLDPAAIISEDVCIEEGVQIMAGAIIQPGSFIGENAIINTGAIVEHDCNINKYVHLCPGVVVSGGSIIGENSFIGAGTTVIHGITIGRNVIVGAGAVVVKDIPNDAIVKGVPAK